MRVGIIGGGATGLSAAYDLAKLRHRVSIYEKNDFLGGHASTFNINGTPIERGYHHWFTSDNSVIELCEELDIGDVIDHFVLLPMNRSFSLLRQFLP